MDACFASPGPRCGPRPGARPRQAGGDAAAGGDGGAVRRGAALRADALGLGLCRGLRRGRDGRRAGRLVCRGGAVPPAARPADPAYRHHPAQPRAHRRQSRQLHRDQFPGARAGREEAGRGRLRRPHGRLAGRPRAQRGAGGLRDRGCCRRRWRRSTSPACAGSSASACRPSCRRIELAPLAAGLLSAVTETGPPPAPARRIAGRARQGS